MQKQLRSLKDWGYVKALNASEDIPTMSNVLAEQLRLVKNDVGDQAIESILGRKFDISDVNRFSLVRVVGEWSKETLIFDGTPVGHFELIVNGLNVTYQFIKH